MKTPRTAGICSAFLLFLCICLWGGCSPGKPAAQVELGDGSPYVGADACRECHPKIFEQQNASRHALTLRLPTATDPPPAPANHEVLDKETGLAYHLEAGNDKPTIRVTEKGKEVASVHFDYLLGSGNHGISPLALVGEEWQYTALTYYGGTGWDFSPMHTLGDPASRKQFPTGVKVSDGDLNRCLGCHTTRLEMDGPRVDEKRSEIGIHCEKCHGPGRAHVEAARAKSTDLAISNPRKWSPDSYLALCQQCHNENSTLDGVLRGIPDDPADPLVVKHHVHGIRNSKCYKISGKLTCGTCHNPHGNSGTDKVFFEDRCRSCHTGDRATATAKTCPVDARKGCVTCHMPKVPVEKHTNFSDHWIRVKNPYMPKR